jgi:uncharacterized repeat protein (TIGR02543 family)
VVTLTAVANIGYTFSGWSGDVSGINNPITITMDDNKTVTATFTQNQYTLTVNVTGLGSVTITPNKPTYLYGDVVTLTAVANIGSTFSGWSGDVSGISNPITITMNGNKTVTATFTQNQYTLTINVTGLGSVTIAPNKSTYLYGDVVTLTAVANIGYTFSGWSGDVSGINNPITITMDGNKTVTATFTQNQYTLTVNVTGLGSVTVSPDRPTYVYGNIVTLTATPAPGYRFVQWMGDLTGSANPGQITIDGNKSVTAVFVRQYTLSVQVSPVGAGSVSPSGGTFDSGTTVSLTAILAPGYRFFQWTGDLTGSSNPAQITMDGDKSVTAVFIQQFNLSAGVSPPGAGFISLDPPGGTYDLGTFVSLTAVAAPSYRFDHWEGALIGSRNPEQITMDGNKFVTAVFAIQYTVSVSQTGNGTVRVVPDGPYDPGTKVTLYIRPAFGSHLVDVIVDGTSMGRINRITFREMTEDHTIYVIFE